MRTPSRLHAMYYSAFELFPGYVFGHTCLPPFTACSRPSNFVSTCLSLPMFLSWNLRSIRVSPSRLQLPLLFYILLFKGYSPLYQHFLSHLALLFPVKCLLVPFAPLTSFLIAPPRPSSPLLSPPSSAPEHPLESGLFSSFAVMHPIPTAAASSSRGHLRATTVESLAFFPP